MATPLESKEKELPPETLAFFRNDELRARVFYDKYALRDTQGRVVEKTPVEMWRRVAREIASVENTPERRKEWEEKFYWLLSGFRFIPGGRIMHAAGNPRRVTALNCYVIPIQEDSLEAIFQWTKEAARTYSLGGGVGTDVSILRPRGAPVNNAALSSTGSVSFMEIFSLTTGTIGQSGRRGALMITIRDSHPDVLDFIKVKRNLDKVRYANISVRVSDAFMRAVEEDRDFQLYFENDRVKVTRTVRAREIWNELVRSARDFAEPGLIFWDNVVRWSTSEYNGMNVITTNPCSLTGDTRVFTPQGLIPLEELAERGARELKGPMVLIDRRAGDGEGVAAVIADRFAFTGVKPIWRVETSSGFILRGTGDHKVKVLNHNTYDPQHRSRGWKRIDELQEGDVLLLPDLNDEKWLELVFSDRSWDIQLDGGRVQRQGGHVPDLSSPIPRRWTEELAYWLGYALGNDSHILEARLNGNGTQTPYDEKSGLLEAETPVLERVLLPSSGAGLKVLARPGTKDRISIQGTAFRQLLLALGLEAGKGMGKGVPEPIFRAPREVTASFLRGLFDAKGTLSIPPDGLPEISLPSLPEGIIRGVQLLLLQFGIPSSVTYGQLSISGYPCIERFYRHIGSALPERLAEMEALLRDRRKNLGDVEVTTKVKGVYQEGVSEPVYDLTVLDTKSFIGNGIIVSNSEIPLEPYGNCCLGNINLAAFVLDPFTPRARLDWESLEPALRFATRFLDNVLDYNANRHPLHQQREASLNSRRIGVGFTGLGDMLAKLCIKYDTEEALNFVDRLFDRVKNTVYDESVNLAIERGTFPLYDPQQHLQGPFLNTLQPKVLERIKAHGLRNVALLTVPPVGSGAALAGVSSGIEPIFDISYVRRSESLAQESFRVYHPLVREYLERMGIRDQGGAAFDQSQLPDYFVTAHRINPEFRVRMQATIQKHIDHAISSTVNLPQETTAEDVSRIYFLAWKMGCKGITVYREGSREGILLTREAAKAPKATAAPRERPATVKGVTERIRTGHGNMYITLNFDSEGRPFEVFTTLGKAGSCDSAHLEAISRLVSLALRCGIEPREIIKQLQGITCHPAWDAQVMVRSAPDAVALALSRHLAPEKEERGKLEQIYSAQLALFPERGLVNGVQCPDCSSFLVYQGGCLQCPSCGYERCG